MHELVKSQAQPGQGMVEYGLIMVLVSVAAVATVVMLGPAVSDMLQRVVDQIP